ncbi:MAG: hypothetical protein LBP53_06085 [Candidatus Peribacteria bacterium]|jgi:hypothetical protein|nr:hypothetical protein [Candidatus Peribacteria bacterium]
MQPEKEWKKPMGNLLILLLLIKMNIENEEHLLQLAITINVMNAMITTIKMKNLFAFPIVLKYKKKLLLQQIW